MPFIGKIDGKILGPEDVNDGAITICPKCDGELRVRGPYKRNGSFVCRHFFHNTDSVGCGGESDRHFEMKYIALSKLKSTFPVKRSGVEVPIGDRIADVLVEFEKPIDRFGNGVIAEIQYKNKSKDVESVERDYLEHGYSVYWLYAQHFDGMDVAFPDPVLVWPNAVPESGSGYNNNFYLNNIVYTPINQCVFCGNHGNYRLCEGSESSWGPIGDICIHCWRMLVTTSNKYGCSLCENSDSGWDHVHIIINRERDKPKLAKLLNQETLVLDLCRRCRHKLGDDPKPMTPFQISAKFQKLWFPFDGWAHRAYRNHWAKIGAFFKRWDRQIDKTYHKRDERRVLNNIKNSGSRIDTVKTPDCLSGSALTGYVLFGDNACPSCNCHWPKKDNKTNCPRCGNSNILA